MPSQYPEPGTITTASLALTAQREAFVAAGPVDVATRKARLQRVIDMLVSHSDALCQAMDEDFGGRPAVFSLSNDILGSLGSLKHARDHLESWLGDQPRASVAPFDSFGATAWVRYQPKGVVGIIGTWNAPVFTLFSPLACVLAAGNRAVLKPSEITPRTAAAVARAVAEYFTPDELAVVTGGPEVAAGFSALPWDHLVFTGSTAVGKEVMKAAAANLVPVTLELGGKSPVLVGRSASVANAAERIVVGKSLNGGQLCVAPDVVWLPHERLEDFLAEARAVWQGLFPTEAGNGDVVAVVNQRHLERIEGYLADAAARGVRIEPLGAGTQASAGERRLPLRVAVNPPPESAIAQHEIFGPAMVVRTYGEIAEAVAAINAGERPLALYYFGADAAEQDWVLGHTLSGGVSINDVAMHPALHDAPFGGVGASGMGHYHGREGFLSFSHERAVYKAGDHDPRREWGMLPPYQPQFVEMVRGAVTP
ncbi:coniferyl aldehyde dehydrogenase [Cupriavidus necator]|uniref:Aldehyde dehydrogenase n=1 Tax=Cupriavidus necator TaxID=106590 RepID=A0A1U9V0I8_CUPNE|nr:coniferyl aldehyde dehydrogenase [Cupriavidus necator]AQV98329.1 coniferyl aldehyde dehydrogenase [Cupriavidus necator]